MPATSSKVMLVCSLLMILARALPKLPSMPPGSAAVAKLAEDEEPDKGEDQQPGNERQR